MVLVELMSKTKGFNLRFYIKTLQIYSLIKLFSVKITFIENLSFYYKIIELCVS